MKPFGFCLTKDTPPLGRIKSDEAGKVEAKKGAAPAVVGVRPSGELPSGAFSFWPGWETVAAARL